MSGQIYPKSKVGDPSRTEVEGPKAVSSRVSTSGGRKALLELQPSAHSRCNLRSLEAAVDFADAMESNGAG